jgi:ADP-heptose:LPS heptosyltransferase
MVVSGNTGVMHMAAALRKKQIAIHGPTNPIIWGPLNPHSKIVMSPCPNCPCLKLGFEYHTKDQSCMRKIDVEQVKNAFIELMKMEIHYIR